jgi:vancomycin permeability regulator SanA
MGMDGNGAVLSIYLIIFGAAVRPDGTASGSLARRVQGALAAAKALDSPIFLATGGVGRYGPAEAIVMRIMLLAAGIPDERILVEDKAFDTLDSVRRCHLILQQRADAELVIPCTSNYHTPRCAWLLRLLGYRVKIAAMPGDGQSLGFGKLLLYVVKEILVTPYDLLLLLFQMRGDAWGRNKPSMQRK